MSLFASSKIFQNPPSGSQEAQQESRQENYNNSQQGFARSNDSTPRLVARYDGQILYASNEFLELSVLDSVEGQHINDLFYFNDHEGEIHDGVYYVTLKETDQELCLQFSWLTDQNNETYLVASAETISEPVSAANKLVSQVETQIIEQKWAPDPTPFLDISFDACTVSELDGQFDTVNENFTQMLGYTQDDMAGKNFTDILHPEYRSAFINGIQSLRQNADINTHISLDAFCIDASNKAKWIEWNHKKVGEKIYSTGRDLTPLKSYKDSLKRQERKLNEAEAIGHIGQWEWAVGSDEISFSDQLYQIFGIPKRSFKPTLDSITKMIHRDDSERMMQVFQRAIIEQNDYDMDFRLTRPDGDIRYIRCEGRCEIDGDDDVVALYGIMQDITETTRKERDLRKAKESVERAYAAKTQFLANMSHELRTPLNAIIGFSEMIERQLLGPIGTEKYLEYISGIRESGEHLLDLISDILDMSKIEAGKYDLNIEEFTLSKVIRMAAHMMEGRAVEEELKLNVECDEEELKIVADRRAVMQMVLNLLSNAVKFSKAKGEINITMKKNAGGISIIVEDHGIGIPANKLANITMPFEQAESDYTREYEGTGLGLSITKELAEIHGGSLHIDSVFGEGTTVTIKLPLKAKNKNS